MESKLPDNNNIDTCIIELRDKEEAITKDAVIFAALEKCNLTEDDMNGFSSKDINGFRRRVSNRIVKAAEGGIIEIIPSKPVTYKAKEVPKNDIEQNKRARASYKKRSAQSEKRGRMGLIGRCVLVFALSFICIYYGYAGYLFKSEDSSPLVKVTAFFSIPYTEDAQKITTGLDSFTLHYFENAEGYSFGSFYNDTPEASEEFIDARKVLIEAEEFDLECSSRYYLDFVIRRAKGEIVTQMSYTVTEDDQNNKQVIVDSESYVSYDNGFVIEGVGPIKLLINSSTSEGILGFDETLLLDEKDRIEVYLQRMETRFCLVPTREYVEGDKDIIPHYSYPGTNGLLLVWTKEEGRVYWIERKSNNGFKIPIYNDCEYLIGNEYRNTSDDDFYVTLEPEDLDLLTLKARPEKKILGATFSCGAWRFEQNGICQNMYCVSEKNTLYAPFTTTISGDTQAHRYNLYVYKWKDEFGSDSPVAVVNIFRYDPVTDTHIYGETIRIDTGFSLEYRGSSLNWGANNSTGLYSTPLSNMTNYLFAELQNNEIVVRKSMPIDDVISNTEGFRSSLAVGLNCKMITEIDYPVNGGNYTFSHGETVYLSGTLEKSIVLEPGTKNNLIAKIELTDEVSSIEIEEGMTESFSFDGKSFPNFCAFLKSQRVIIANFAIPISLSTVFSLPINWLFEKWRIKHLKNKPSRIRG